MSILSRWRNRLRIRQRLQKDAEQRLASARRRNVHPRQALVDLVFKRRAQVRYAKRVIKRHENERSPAMTAVKWALAQVGTVEHPSGSNWGPKIKDWIQASGYGFPVAWCQCFANAVAVRGGAKQLRDGYTPTVLAGRDGYKPIPYVQAKPGDFIFFKFPGVSAARCDHVGVLIEKTSSGPRCAEGNTSSGTAGSQNNGGGVFIRTRPLSLVAGAVRPPYPKD